ncbi:MAG TPA: hypothetical protein VGH66_01455 [Acidimicrobiales bacterium]|jgi:hypothetical protein
MQGQSQIVAIGGVALVGVNFWTSAQRPTLSAVFDGSGDATAGHQAFLAIGAELLLVLVMAFAAGASGTVGNAMVAVMATLWVLWAIRYYSAKGTAAGTASARFAAPGPAMNGAGVPVTATKPI